VTVTLRAKIPASKPPFSPLPDDVRRITRFDAQLCPTNHIAVSRADRGYTGANRVRQVRRGQEMRGRGSRMPSRHTHDLPNLKLSLDAADYVRLLVLVFPNKTSVRRWIHVVVVLPTPAVPSPNAEFTRNAQTDSDRGTAACVLLRLRRAGDPARTPSLLRKPSHTSTLELRPIHADRSLVVLQRPQHTPCCEPSAPQLGNACPCKYDPAHCGTGAAWGPSGLLHGLRWGRRLLPGRRRWLLLRGRGDVLVLGHRSLQGSVDL